MNFDKPFTKGSLLVVVGAILIAGTLSLSSSHSGSVNPKDVQGNAENVAFFSPKENLETEDLRLLNSAASTIDIAMYSFTDLRIEEALAEAAHRGVKIRLYRDGLQSANEESRALRNGSRSTTELLRGISNVEIKIKPSSQSMHLKAFCIDKRLLRTGSANWSPQGETRQDNDLYVITNQISIGRFDDDFESLWDRLGNKIP